MIHWLACFKSENKFLAKNGTILEQFFEKRVLCLNFIFFKPFCHIADSKLTVSTMTIPVIGFVLIFNRSYMHVANQARFYWTCDL